MAYRSAESGPAHSGKVKLRLVTLALLAFVLLMSAPWWAGPLTRVWLAAGYVAEAIRDETVGDDMWRGFAAVGLAEGKIDRKEVLKRLGEPDQSVAWGSSLPSNLAARYAVPEHDGGEGGLFIYQSVRPIGYCFIFFDAEGNVEKVVTRNLD